MHTVQKILIIRLSSLGDIILTEPIARALRAKYPDAQIDFVVKKEFAPIPALFGSLSNVIPFDLENGLHAIRERLRTEQYDCILDLHNNFRSSVLRKIGAKKVFVINKRTFARWLLVKFKINLLKQASDIIGRYFEIAKHLGVIDNGSAPRIIVNATKEKKAAICPGAKHWNKRWLVENFVKIAKRLSSQGYAIEVHGAKEEFDLGEQIVNALPSATVKNLCGAFTLAELPQKLTACELAITNDSGLMHLANAVGVRTISIFGPTVRELGFYPRGANATVIENIELDCRPCTTIGREDCPKGHFKCMKEISIEMVVGEIERR